VPGSVVVGCVLVFDVAVVLSCEVRRGFPGGGQRDSVGSRLCVRGVAALYM
jgi:hypothetical protein